MIFFGILALVAIAVGIVLFARDFKKYVKYLDVITQTGELAVDGIAVQVNEDVETTKKMLKAMLKKGILKGRLDEKKMGLKLTEWPGGDEEDDKDCFFHPKIKYTHIRKMICPNCGASITVGAKKINKCDYCGQKLEI